jgi:hypothetical protein
MDRITEEGRIAELDKLRTELRWWRWGTSIAIAIVLVSCLWKLNNSVQSLTHEGPEQQMFVSELNQGLQRDVVPNLQHTISSTITSVQPQVIDALKGLNGRIPDLTQTATNQFAILQKDLPAKSQQILSTTYGNLLAKRKDQIRKLYPNVTEEQIEAVLASLSDEGQKQLALANQELFGPQQRVLYRIMKNLDTIRAQEASNASKTDPSWEMGVIMLDLVRDDLKDLAPGAPAAPAGNQNKTNAAVKTAAMSTTEGVKS